MDKRKFNGGNRNAGRKKGVGISFDIQKHCRVFIEELLKDDAIRLKATKELSETLNDKIESFFYIIKDGDLFKLGYTSDIKNRIKSYKTHSIGWDVVYVCKIIDANILENHIHELHSLKRIKGEWFKLTDLDVLGIISYCSKKLI